jgi:carbon-monoxide dehydrogenase large subunit
MIGASIKRVEDPRLISGEAKYLDDIQLPGMLHAAILRSPYAHANIRSINTERARRVSGVHVVLTGEDFKDMPAMPCAWQAGGVKNNVNTPRVLALGKVTFTGEAVAVVVADNRYIAEDALGMIDVDYEPLGVVVDAEKATQMGAPRLHENAPDNICMDWSCGDQASTEAALDQAEVRVSQRVVNQRLIPTPMETRGAIAQYLHASGEFTVWMTSQAPHVMRLLMTAFVFGIPETKMRVISPQVGGGFGTKIFLYPEYCLVAALSRRLSPR